MTREQRLERALRSLIADIRPMYHSTLADVEVEELFGPFSFAVEDESGTLISWPNLAISLKQAEEALVVGAFTLDHVSTIRTQVRAPNGEVVGVAIAMLPTTRWQAIPGFGADREFATAKEATDYIIGLVPPQRRK